MSNIYLTPRFLEETRKRMTVDGVNVHDADRHIAEFISRKVGDNDQFTQRYKSLRARNSDPAVISGFLDYSIYGTTNPTERFSISEPEESDPFNPLQRQETTGFTQNLQEMGGNIRETINRAGTAAIQTSGRQDLNPVGKTLGVTGDITLGAAEVLAEPFKPIIEAGGELLNRGAEYAKENYGSSITALTEEGKEKIQEDFANVAQAIQEFDKTNPNISQSLKGVLGIVSLALSGKGLEKSVQQVGGGVEILGKKTIEQGAKGIAAAEKVGANARGLLDRKSVAALEKQLLVGKKPPVEDVAKDAELFHKYADRYGIKQKFKSGKEASLVPDDELTVGAVDNVEAQRVQILDDAQRGEVTKLLQPKRTKGELQELFRKNPELVSDAKGGLIKSSKGPLATQGEKDLAREISRIAPEIQSAKTPVEAGPILRNKIAEKGAVLDSSLQQNPFLIPKTESASRIRKAIANAADDFGESPNIFKAELNRYLRFREKFPGNGYGERRALIAYDADTAARYGTSIYDKATARAQAVSTIRESSQNLLHESAARAGVRYLPEIEDMATLYRGLDNVSTHVSNKVFESTMKSFVKSPVGRATTQAAGVGTAIQLLP